MKRSFIIFVLIGLCCQAICAEVKSAVFPVTLLSFDESASTWLGHEGDVGSRSALYVRATDRGAKGAKKDKVIWFPKGLFFGGFPRSGRCVQIGRKLIILHYREKKCITYGIDEEAFISTAEFTQFDDICISSSGKLYTISGHTLGEIRSDGSNYRALCSVPEGGRIVSCDSGVIVTYEDQHMIQVIDAATTSIKKYYGVVATRLTHESFTIYGDLMQFGLANHVKRGVGTLVDGAIKCVEAKEIPSILSSSSMSVFLAAEEESLVWIDEHANPICRLPFFSVDSQSSIPYDRNLLVRYGIVMCDRKPYVWDSVSGVVRQAVIRRGLLCIVRDVYKSSSGELLVAYSDGAVDVLSRDGVVIRRHIICNGALYAQPGKGGIWLSDGRKLFAVTTGSGAHCIAQVSEGGWVIVESEGDLFACIPRIKNMKAEHVGEAGIAWASTGVEVSRLDWETGRVAHISTTDLKWKGDVGFWYAAWFPSGIGALMVHDSGKAEIAFAIETRRKIVLPENEVVGLSGRECCGGYVLTSSSMVREDMCGLIVHNLESGASVFLSLDGLWMSMAAFPRMWVCSDEEIVLYNEFDGSGYILNEHGNSLSASPVKVPRGSVKAFRNAKTWVVVDICGNVSEIPEVTD